MSVLSCKKCKQSKPSSLFYFRADTGTYRTECKECHAQVKRNYNIKNKDKVFQKYREYRTKNEKQLKNKIIKAKYGITIADYEKMLSEQGGACKICNKNYIRPTSKRMAIDHCHETGEIRGVLCTRCNTALGLVFESGIILRNMINYLEECNDTPD